LIISWINNKKNASKKQRVKKVKVNADFFLKFGSQSIRVDLKPRTEIEEQEK
jgi:hypothetical protein